MAERKKYLYNFCIFLIAILGIYIRINILRNNFSLWHDECALAWNIKFKTFSGLFAPLNFNQMAPPFFVVATKIMTKFLGYSEYVYRIIPFLFGCAALPAFYALSKKILDKKFSIITAFAFFTLNQNLIKYSCEFKPYILDVFFTIICLLFFLNLDLKSISRKRTLIYGVLLAFLPWCSLPTVFVISAGIIILLFKNFEFNLKFWKKPVFFKFSNVQLIKNLLLIFPIALSLLIYLKVFIINNYSHSNYLLSFWDIAFLNKGAKSIFFVLLITLDYLFNPVNYTFFVSIFLIFSFAIMFKHKREFAKISLLTLGLLIAASYLNIYPFASRLTLFIFPILLVTLLKPLDFISFNKKSLSFLLITFYLIAFYSFPKKVVSYLSANTFDRKEYPREMTAFIMEKLKPQDVIYVNNSSDADFAYYSSFYKFENKVIQENILPNITKEEYFKKLNSLKKGTYWIFAPIDFTNTPVYPWLEEWSFSKKILYCKENNKKDKSLILYIELK